MKLFDSEWKVMEVLWQKNDRTAKEISLCLADSIGWNKNTTYTVIKKCIDKVFGGSAELLFASILSDRSLSKDELARLRALVEAQEA